MATDLVSNEVLDELERLSAAADPPPWRSLIEGRDHVASDSFVMVGDGTERGEDLYLSRDGNPAGVEDLDLVAAARTYLPALIAEIRRHRGFGADGDATSRIRVSGDEEVVLAMNRPGLRDVKGLLDGLHAHEGESHHVHLDPWSGLEDGSKSIVLSLLPNQWFDERVD